MRFLLAILFLLGSLNSYAQVLPTAKGGDTNRAGNKDGQVKGNAVKAPIKVGVRTLPFFDHNSKRPLVTEIWYPTDSQATPKTQEALWLELPESRDAPFADSAAKKPLPLIIFSHGDGGNRLNLSWLAHALVQKGYIVAAIDHYESRWNSLDLPKITLQRWLRPRDISYGVRQLLHHSLFKEIIDPDKIGFVGFSLGGLTGIWLAGGIANQYRKPSVTESSLVELPLNIDKSSIDSTDFSPAKESYRDPIIKAAFLMAPAYGFAFDVAGLQSIKIPVMIVAGEFDERVPIKENALFFGKSIPNSQIKIFPGKVGHFVFFNETTLFGKKHLPAYLIQDDASINRHNIHQEISELAVQFFNNNLEKR